MRRLGPLVIAGMLVGFGPSRQAQARTNASAGPTPGTEAEPTTDPSTPPPSTEPARTEIPRAILRVEGLAFEEVRDALAPRLPTTELLPFDDAAFEAVGSDPFAYVELVLEPGSDGEVALTIVLSDHRAYLRRFVPEPEHPVRSIATTIANTLAAIEEERIEADEQEVEVPRPEPEPPVETEPTETEPEPPVEAQPIEPEAQPPREAPPPPPPPYELGIAGTASAVIGMAPSAVRSFAAAGGDGRLGVRLRRGAMVELGLRILSRGREEHRLWRNRLALAGGYAWRYERFGLTAVAGPTVEPWSVRRDGAAASISPVQSVGATPLWGAMAAVTPSWHWRVAPTLSLSLGLRTEVSTSVLGSGQAARVLAGSTVEPAPLPSSVLFTLGGVELTTGLELTLWIAPPGTRPVTRVRPPRSTPRWSRSASR